MGNSSETRARLLECGKEEFLDKGFEGASLRTIAKKAGVTTGAIYGYFADKEALFNAIVEEPAAGLMEFFVKGLEEFEALSLAKQEELMGEYSIRSMDWMVDYMYDHLAEFKLIVSHSAGTLYENYVHHMVEEEERHTWNFIERLRISGRCSGISRDVVHILCSACYNGIFEVIIHDTDRKQAISHIHTLTEFFTAGWNRLVGL